MYIYLIKYRLNVTLCDNNIRIGIIYLAVVSIQKLTSTDFHVYFIGRIEDYVDFFF